MPDIFVSYAHVDNQPPFGQEHGWVTYFVENLKQNVSRRMGRDEKYELWMDYKLQGNDELTPALKEKLKTVDTLLIFLSPGWLASEWCRWELETFLEQERGPAGRLFVVELEKLDETGEKPAALTDMLGYRFWRETHEEKLELLGFPLPNPENSEDKAYFIRLLNLSVEIAHKFKELIRQENSQPLSKPEATVYVAPVGDALMQERDRLISELNQYRIAVLPRANFLKLDSVMDDMEKALENCSHFIQLLDEDYLMGIPANQHLLAESAEKPILQWRSPALDISTVTNPEQKQLLQGKDVIAATLSDFVRQVREKVLPKPAEEEPEIKTGGNRMVFVHTGQQDMALARQIAQVLKEKGLGFVLPRYKGSADAIRKNIERNIGICHLLLLLQQKTPLEVIEDTLADVVLHTHERETDLPIAVCLAEDEAELFVNPPNTRIFECKQPFDEQCLEHFLKEVAV